MNAFEFRKKRSMKTWRGYDNIHHDDTEWWKVDRKEFTKNERMCVNVNNEGENEKVGGFVQIDVNCYGGALKNKHCKAIRHKERL